MLKRVPDPPFNLHSLDDTRLLKSTLSLWDDIFPPAVLMQPRLCVSVLRRASTHDLDTLRTSTKSAQVHA